MMPQSRRHSHVTPQSPRVTTPALDADATLVLLAEARNGRLTWHRAGFVAFDDGLVRAPELLGWWITALWGRGLVVFGEPDRWGDKPIEITVKGLHLRAELLGDKFGGFADVDTDVADLDVPPCELPDIRLCCPCGEQTVCTCNRTGGVA